MSELELLHNPFGKGNSVKGGVVPEGVYHRGPRNRIPFSLVMENDMTKLFQFWVNPSECSWSIGLRTTVEKVPGGAVHHQWTSTGIGAQQPSVFEQPVIQFSFQAGIVVPYMYQDVTWDKRDLFPPGLGNFYDFLEILNQPDMTSDGRPNYVNIMYVSSTFPKLWLQGFFTSEGVSWTDTAENPYTISSWGARFEVFASQPRLSNADELRNIFSTFGINKIGSFDTTDAKFTKTPSNPT